jgi:gelsolin
LSFDLIKDGTPIQRTDLDGNDVFLVDIGSAIWVWRGLKASKAEKAMWLNVAQSYVRQLQGGADSNVHLMPLASVVEGNESPAFFKAIEV